MSKYTETPLKHLFDLSDFDLYDTKVVNLSAGAPGPDLFKEVAPLFQKATEHRMKYESENDYHLFQYGPSVGSVEARQSLSEFLSKNYHDEVVPASLVVTTGATQGLHLILSTILDMNAVIFVDEVTYMIALEAISQFTTMKVVTVPFSMEHGVDTNSLEKLILEHKFKHNENKLFWGVYYTIPTFHNPTGVLFSEETNKKLIQIARKHDVLIVCDDVYNLLCYDDKIPPKRLFAFDVQTDADYQGNVISNGSFSKILSPGVRLGWMECPPKVVDIFRNCGILKSGGCANGYTSGILSSMIQLGFMDQLLELYFKRYKERMEVACEILQQKLNKDCKVFMPKGGYFIWITFPETVNCLDLNEFCRTNYQVFGICGTRFSAKGGFLNCMRLTIAFHEKSVLQAAFTRFCEAYEAYIEGKKP